VQQYLAQSVLARLWGDAALSAELRREAEEELQHAERLMERLIELGMAPSAGSILPARLGRSPADLLAADRELEVDAVHLYREAATHSRRMRDTDSTALLEALLNEESRHVEEIDALMTRTPHG
jgi:bacterioferritin